MEVCGHLVLLEALFDENGSQKDFTWSQMDVWKWRHGQNADPISIKLGL